MHLPFFRLSRVALLVLLVAVGLAISAPTASAETREEFKQWCKQQGGVYSGTGMYPTCTWQKCEAKPAPALRFYWQATATQSCATYGRSLMSLA
jgi:hypothetical protein